MGSKVSRQTLAPEMLQDGDIVLIRQKLRVSGVEMSSTVSNGIERAIRTTSSVSGSIVAPYWDRSAVVVLPELPREDYNLRTIRVVQAKASGVQSQSLEELLNCSEQLAIRPLAESYSDRLDDFFLFITSVCNRNYEDCRIAVEPMMRAASQYIHSASVDEGTKQEFEQIFQTCASTKQSESLGMDEFLKFCAQLDKAGLNAFTHESIQNLIVKVRGEGAEIFKQELFEEWETMMIERARDQLDLGRCISGGFVSLCLQKLGVLKSEQFYLPMQLAQADLEGFYKSEYTLQH